MPVASFLEDEVAPSPATQKRIPLPLFAVRVGE